MCLLVAKPEGVICTLCKLVVLDKVVSLKGGDIPVLSVRLLLLLDLLKHVLYTVTEFLLR